MSSLVAWEMLPAERLRPARILLLAEPPRARVCGVPLCSRVSAHRCRWWTTSHGGSCCRFVTTHTFHVTSSCHAESRPFSVHLDTQGDRWDYEKERRTHRYTSTNPTSIDASPMPMPMPMPAGTATDTTESGVTTRGTSCRSSTKTHLKTFLKTHGCRSVRASGDLEGEATRYGDAT